MADKHDQVLQEIADQYGLSDEDVQKLRDASPLRTRLAEIENELKEERGAKAELAAMKRGPKVNGAFGAYGVDVENLSAAERHVIEGLQFAGDEPTEDEIADAVKRFDLPIREAEEQEEAPAAAAIVEQATRPQGTRGGKSPAITPNDVAGWSGEKIARFEKEHPEEMERILQGESVVVGSVA